MELNVETSFTNIPKKTNFKKKEDDALLDLFEPPTSLGFISANINSDISDLFYIRDAMYNEKSMEGLKKVKEDEDLHKFRMTSSSKPASSQQYGVINMKKIDSGEPLGLSSQIKMKLTKKRKITIDESESLGKGDHPSSQRTEINAPLNKADHTPNSDVVVPSSILGLSSLIGIYDDEDSE